MKAVDEAKELLGWSKKAAGLKEPPRLNDGMNNLAQPEHAPGNSEPVEQINFKVPVQLNFKQRLKMMAAKEKISMLTLFKRMVDLYERQHREKTDG